MPCYRPLNGWREYDPKTRKASISFGRHTQFGYVHLGARKRLTLPCGQCIGCRLERSRRWAIRLMHEAQMHEANSFITLTYSDEHLPSDGSLQVKDFQDFMKRLRRGSSGPLRFFHCGEYGEENGRPHYHMCLFGEDFSADRVFAKPNKRGEPLYHSRRLSEVWGNGECWIGELTFESAAYVARYCLKKAALAGKAGPDLDARKSAYSKWLAGRRPEYVTMSRRPGIGAGWFKKFGAEVYPSDSVVMRGRELMPPPFYDKLLEKLDPELLEEVKKERRLEAPSTELYSDWLEHLGGKRLHAKEVCKEQTVTQTLKRNL